MTTGDSGSNQATSVSVQSIVTALVVNGAIFIVSIAAFLYLRPRQPRIYQPRATVATIADEDRPRPLAKGPLWFKDLLTRKDSEILRDAGLDGYFFLRYLRIGLIICLVGVVTLYPILLAVNATGGAGNAGFDVLAFGNVSDPKRYYAAALLSWIFFGFVVFTLYREMCYYVAVRQAVLTSPAYSTLISSRSILIATVPKEYLSVEGITGLFDGVKYVWINRNQSKLAKKIKERTKLAGKVESAEVKYLKTAVKNRLKSEKKAPKVTPIEGQDIHEYVPDKKRPTHRLKPIFGKKVDTIDYGSDKIQELNTEILEMQQAYTDSKPLNSAFVTFETQEHAEVAYQTLAHHRAFQMAPRHIGIRPDDVFWPNLRLEWWERLFRSYGAAAAITALVIFWSIPVAFVGSLTNLDSLTNKVHFLRFLNNLPKKLKGLVTSLLPTILLAVLMMVLPIFIRSMAKIAGRPTGTAVEFYTQNAYFAFQVVQVFLVTTISSAATSVVTKIIEDPTSALSLLAANLPKASNFYISYFLLQGLTATGTMLVQVVALVLFHVMHTLLDSTPRKIWSRWNVLGSTGWGTIFPIYTNMLVITLTYSLIAPIILIFSALTYLLLYFGYLHNLMFITTPTEGRGLFYARAIQQTFTGLYLAEVCMIGLFAVSKAWGPLVLEAIILAVTIFTQINMGSAFAPLRSALPRDLLRETSSQLAGGLGLKPVKQIGFDEEHDVTVSSTDSAEKVGTVNGSNTLAATSTYETMPPASQDEYPVTNATTGAAYTAGEPYGHEVEKLQRPSGASSTRPLDPSGSPPGEVHDSAPETEKGFGKKISGHVGIFSRYFFPHKYLTPEILQRDFLPDSYHLAAAPLAPEVESMAFANPAVNNENPVIWMPRDPWGLSQIEVEKLQEHGLNAYDSATWFEINDAKKKSKIETSSDLSQIPIWTAPVKY